MDPGAHGLKSAPGAPDTPGDGVVEAQRVFPAPDANDLAQDSIAPDPLDASARRVAPDQRHGSVGRVDQSHDAMGEGGTARSAVEYDVANA